MSHQAPPLFLREDELKHGLELLILSSAQLYAEADRALAKEGLGRADLRVLHLIGRRRGLAVSELMALLGVTKQSLARVLDSLSAGGLVRSETASVDRRRRLLFLTEEGAAVEKRLFAALAPRLAGAYRAAGAQAVGDFWAVLEAIAGARRP